VITDPHDMRAHSRRALETVRELAGATQTGHSDTTTRPQCCRTAYGSGQAAPRRRARQ
jgi:hypothetical protein